MGWGKTNVLSFASRVRAAALKLGANGAEITTAALSHECDVRTLREQRQLSWAVRDLKREEHLATVSKGVYRLGDQAAARPTAPQKKHVMWRTLRGRRTVTVDDLIELAGVSRAYAREWLRVLLRRGVVRELAGKKYQLIKDSVESPSDTAKAEKLRELRRARKEHLLAAIDHAQIRLTEASQLLDDARGALAVLDPDEEAANG